jgi:hypothetical protein
MHTHKMSRSSNVIAQPIHGDSGGGRKEVISEAVTSADTRTGVCGIWDTGVLTIVRGSTSSCFTHRRRTSEDVKAIAAAGKIPPPRDSVVSLLCTHPRKEVQSLLESFIGVNREAATSRYTASLRNTL